MNWTSNGLAFQSLPTYLITYQ